jgi:putative NADH-flavin reductase
MINDKSISIPHLNTLWNWSSKNNWKQLSIEQNLIVEDKVNKRIVNKQVNDLDKMQSIVNDLKDVSYLALQKVTNALKQDLMKPIENASELKALVDSVNKAVTTHSLLVGGVTSRSESISHNTSNKKQIREEIMQLIASLNQDGIQIQMDEETDKSKLN